MCHFFPGISLVYFCIFVFAIKMPTATEVIPFFTPLLTRFSAAVYEFTEASGVGMVGLLLIDKKAPFFPISPGTS